MKKALLIAPLILFLMSCQNEIKNKLRYVPGDIIYFKVDDQRAIIIDTNLYFGDYEIQYTHNDLVRHFASDKELK